MLERSTSKKAVKDIGKVLISNVFKLLSGIMVGFLLPKIIGITDYGYYKTFTLYATYVGLFHFGFSDGIYLKYGGKGYDELEKTNFRAFTRTLFLLELAISFIAFIPSFLLLAGEIRFIFICLIVYLLAFNITNYYQIVSQITGRFSELSWRNSIQAFFTIISILVLWLLHKYFDYNITYRIYTVIYVIISSLLCIWYIVTYREITFGKSAKGIWKKSLKEFIKLGFPLLVGNLCSTFILAIDRQFVNILFDTETYAIYAFAYNMLALITTALSAISTVLYPMLKRADERIVQKNYSFLITILLILVFACLLVYFPLCPFVTWFLPKYFDSLIIFRIILPGLSISSTVTIVMHNYYKAENKETLYFFKCIIILLFSGVANFLAYYFFKDTKAISIASIIVMLVWYVLVEFYFIKKYKTKWLKNISYIFIMSSAFYVLTIWNIWWLTMILYLSVYILFSILLFKTEIKKIWLVFFKKQEA